TPSPKPGPKSVNYVPGLNCQRCPRLDNIHEAQSAGGATQSSYLPEYVSRIVFHAVSLQQSDESLLVRHLSVMRLLGPNIAQDGAQVGCAYAEYPEPTLPCEGASHPLRRTCLNFLQRIRK